MHSYFYFANTVPQNRPIFFAKQKNMGKNALAFLVLFIASRQIGSRFPYGNFFCKANLPVPHPTLLYSFLPIYININKNSGASPAFFNVCRSSK